MKLLRTVSTPWHPYAVTFSPDGLRLAVGGGSWYGHGGILLIGLDDWQCELQQWDDVPGVAVEDAAVFTPAPTSVPTVSGLCFSDDSRVLAASTWLSCQHYRPTILFYVDGMTLGYRAQFERDFDTALDPCPTGVLLHAPHLITRNHGGDPEGDHVIVVDPLPPDVCASGRLQHLTHHRVVVIRNTAVSEAGGARNVTRKQPDGRGTPVPAPEGLALRDLDDPTGALRIIPVEDCPRITAIAALPGNQGFATGGSRGELDIWTWTDRWRQQRVRAPVPLPDAGAHGRALYRSNTVTAIVSPVRSTTLAAVTAGGTLIRWSPGGVEDTWNLPDRGSPRSMAAHPNEPWIAIGMKQGDFTHPEAAVLIVDWP